MKLSKILLITIAATAFAACSEEEFKTFEGEVSGIYLQRQASWNLDTNGSPLYYTYADSIVVSFTTSAGHITQREVELPVRIMGNTTDYDRPFTLTVDETQSNAQRGVHYDYNDADCVIAANTAETNLPITIYRHDDLKAATYQVVFSLEDNNYFTTELDEYRSNGDWQATAVDTLCGSSYKVIFSEILTRPSSWSNAENYLGKWSADKETRVNALVGWSHRSWERYGYYDGARYGQLAYAAKLVRKELQELADAGTPVYDEANNEYMQLGEDFQVDYSAYQ